MRLRSGLTRTLLACFLATLIGCVEYRLERRGQPDRYYGWAKTVKNLDPKLGSKGKLYFTDRGNIRPYIGGNFRRNNARVNLGVIHYLSRTSSIELGWRRSLFSVERYHNFNNSRVYRVNPFKDAKEIFYIGGVIRF